MLIKYKASLFSFTSINTTIIYQGITLHYILLLNTFEHPASYKVFRQHIYIRYFHFLGYFGCL